nr:hypothetical protein CFP56_02609 [Quercus suber]
MVKELCMCIRGRSKGKQSLPILRRRPWAEWRSDQPLIDDPKEAFKSVVYQTLQVPSDPYQWHDAVRYQRRRWFDSYVPRRIFPLDRLNTSTFDIYGDPSGQIGRGDGSSYDDNEQQLSEQRWTAYHQIYRELANNVVATAVALRQKRSLGTGSGGGGAASASQSSQAIDPGL